MPCVPAKTVKACALIGLRMMAEESALLVGQRPFSCLGRLVEKRLSQELGMDQLRSDKEADYGFDFYYHNFENIAVEVIGQAGQVK